MSNGFHWPDERTLEHRSRPARRGSRWWHVLAVALAAAPAASPPGAPALPAGSTGVLYTNIVVPQAPWSIHVVRIPRNDRRYEVQSRHAGTGALGLSTLADQIAAADPAQTVAGINGGFYRRDTVYAGCPRGLQIVEGELLCAPCGNVSFWIDVLGEPHTTNVSSRFEITWPDGQITPFGLNEERADHAAVLYTPAAGPSTHTTGGRELVLERCPHHRWLPLRMGRVYSGQVRAVHGEGNTPLHPDQMVLSLGPRIMDRIAGARTGSVVRISTASWPPLLGARTALSGGPLLVQDGTPRKIRSSPDDPYEYSSMLEQHPRTAFGWNPQWFFLVQVDGRQRDLSVGMTLDELSKFLAGLGCEEAINLDGGGSSSLWFDGRIRSSPCDGYDRAIANSLLVLQKKENAPRDSSPPPDPTALRERDATHAN